MCQFTSLLIEHFDSRFGVEKILASKDLKMGRFVVKEMLHIIFNIQLLWGMGPERPAVHTFQSLT